MGQQQFKEADVNQVFGMKTRRRALSALAIGSSAGVLAACGGTATPPATDTTPAKAKNYQGVVIQHMGAPTDPAGLRTYERMIREVFEPAHPGIKVDGIELGGLSTLDKLVVLLAGGTPPDSARMNGYHIAQVAKQFGFLDVASYAEKDKKFIVKDMFEGAWRAGQYRGKQYGIANGMTPTVLMYNKEHFDEAGLAYPPADFKNTSWTWNRMREDAKKLARRDGSGQLSLRRHRL